MNKTILIAISLTLAGCQASKGDAEICRPSNWSGELLTRQHASAAEAEDAFRQCLIHYTYLLAKEGGSADDVTNAVKARCEMAGGRFTYRIREDYRLGRDFWTIPLAERTTILEIERVNYNRVLNEIPNFIVEAKAGDCRP